MKSIKYILGSFAAVAALVATSCTGDLDVTPIDPNINTIDKAVTSGDDFKSLLAGVYLGYSVSGYYGPNGDPSISGLDGGASQYVRGLFNLNELTTDESQVCWNDGTIKDLHDHAWTNSDLFIYAFYSRVAMQISIANEFIRDAKASSLEFTEKNQYIDEARALRALSYLHAIDNFGKFPFADENSSVGSTSPQEISRADLYSWLETELTDLISSSSSLPETNEYGRATKDMARMTLAKLYLNAEVYTGTAQWGRCAEVLNEIVSGGRHSLHSNYTDLFMADNNLCSDEIIFAIEQDGINTQSYGATNYIIFASWGDGMDPADAGISSGWGGLRATDTFYKKFESGDTRKIFSEDSFHQGPILDEGDFTAGGHPTMKFKNINHDGSAAQALGFVDTDFPVYRYADVLLMLAECGLNGASSVSTAQAQAYLNQVRSRAGVGDLALTASNLIDERGRELYYECWRRSDLIRFGLFTGSSYVWDWKGGVEGGTSTDSYRNLFPIPTQDLGANGNLTQNEGY